MSTQFSKRALTTGLGVGALALLAQTQRASADTPFTTFAFPATGAPTPRTMPDRLADVVNVKEFGALGNGSNDDQPAIQAAFNAAFTTAGVPHGTNSYLNREVFFPAGHYVLHNPVTLTQVQGAKITGSGRQSTVIENTTGGGGGAALVTNGLKDSYIAHLGVIGASGSSVGSLELNWNGSGSVGLSGNTFLSIDFGGAHAYGVRIGNGGFGGSNNVFMCCGINLSTIAAIAVVADSAVGNSVVGGNIQHCATGILVTRGSVTAIDGVGFEEQTGYDIDIASTAADGVAVVGIRTESPNFFRAITTKPVTLTANTQGSSPVVFAYLDGCPASIEGCHADGGVISVRNGARVSILNYSTNNLTSAWLDAPAATLWFTPTNPIQGTIELENITYAQASGTPVHTFKQRIYTTNGTSLTTMNYQVGP